MFSSLFLHGKIRNINYIFFQVFVALALVATFIKEYVFQVSDLIFEGQIIFNGFAYTLHFEIVHQIPRMKGGRGGRAKDEGGRGGRFQPISEIQLDSLNMSITFQE